ncbi:NAD(P)-binding protein [Atractiella rhizophila]|nr:NAD(P)-binding protein [Atractiella rhizophila]
MATATSNDPTWRASNRGQKGIRGGLDEAGLKGKGQVYMGINLFDWFELTFFDIFVYFAFLWSLPKMINNPAKLKYEKEEFVDLKGQVAIVTGSNVGVGFETALYLYQRGCFVYLACRDAEKAKKARDAILSSTFSPCEGAGVEYWHLDLASLKSVREFLTRWKKEGREKLDILICNAGAIFLNNGRTEDGLGVCYQVNHLAHFLLTIHLLPWLCLSSRPTIVNTSSMGAFNPSRLNLDKLNGEQYGSRWHWYNKFPRGFTLYAQSKLMQVMSMVRLQELLLSSPHLPHRKIVVQSAHPGMVNSDFMYKSTFSLPHWLESLMLFALNILAYTAKQGSMTILWAALSRESREKKARFWVDCEEKELPKATKDNDLAKEFWERSARDAGCSPDISNYTTTTSNWKWELRN